MDTFVFAKPGFIGQWDVYAHDLSGEVLGTIVRMDAKLYVIKARAEPLLEVDEGPYPDLGAAMSAVSAKLEGMCLYGMPGKLASPWAP